MRLSVGETAALFNVSRRTLRYYDKIGLLAPQGVTEAGYRYYGEAELAALQRILFYRELGFALTEIPPLLTAPKEELSRALEGRIGLLELSRRRLDEQIHMARQALKGETMKKPDISIDNEIKAAKERYAAEAKERWGGTPEYAEAQKRAQSRGDEEAAGEEAAAGEIFSGFASARALPPDSPQALELAARWQAHITKYHYPCTKQILGCLADMYVGDERFTENIDRYGEGTAAFMSAAIKEYCKVQS